MCARARVCVCVCVCVCVLVCTNWLTERSNGLTERCLRSEILAAAKLRSKHSHFGTYKTVAGPCRQMRASVKVQVRSELDPYVKLLELTQWTKDFGNTPGENASTGIVCLVLGLIFSALPCGAHDAALRSTQACRGLVPVCNGCSLPLRRHRILHRQEPEPPPTRAHWCDGEQHGEWAVYHLRPAATVSNAGNVAASYRGGCASDGDGDASGTPASCLHRCVVSHQLHAQSDTAVGMPPSQ
eukprot:COSAG01_NODE_13343_length_1598_cov_1.681121_2_plen_241_part_00